jgi:hypothetical protein
MFRHGANLIERLKEKFPHLRDDTIHGWLRSKVEGNDWLFITNDYGVALAEAVRETLALQTTVIERFVLVSPVAGEDDAGRKERLERCCDLYLDILRWAQGMDAKEIVLETFTDCSREMIKKRMGRLFVRETLFAKVAACTVKPGQKIAL